MNSEDFELASNGYGVQNDRLPAPAPAPGPGPGPPAAARNDSTSCHASAFAGRSAKASTCQTWSPRAITLHGIGHLAANKGGQIWAYPKVRSLLEPTFGPEASQPNGRRRP